LLIRQGTQAGVKRFLELLIFSLAAPIFVRQLQPHNLKNLGSYLLCWE
jgi:hypothetical protein